ncbi:SH3 domain-containing protein [Salinisphaera hydrothermalis]|uniref:SH3 domain-containing protein n=1 Tax=Salinisphaera hydrothermalis TaxID=563188 RepID=UPI003342CDBB
MSARADVRLAIVIAATLVAAPTVAWSAGSDAPAPARAEQILEQNRPLAKQGDASAQYNMGVLYDRGYGVKRDYAKARQWYEKAAAQHYARAEHNLGIMYEAGKGVPRDPSKAAHWFRRGADDGQTASQNNLAVLYMKGEGVPQNTGKAAFWAAKAAAGGNSAAIDNLPRIIAGLPHIHVNAENVNVRDQPNRESRVVGHVDSDTVAVVLSRRDHWTQVLLPDDYTLGWVANFLLSDSQAPLAGNAMPQPAPASSKPGHTGSIATSSSTPAPNANSAGQAQANAAPAKPPQPQSNPEPTQAEAPTHASGKDLTLDRRSAPGPSATGSQATTKAPPETKTASSAEPPAAGSEPADQSKQPADHSQAQPAPSSTAPAIAASKTSATPKQASAGASHPAGKTTAPAKATPKAPSASKKSTPAPTHATVGVDAANLRAKAAGGARVVGQLHRGDRVKLLDEHNGWRYVRTPGGMKGWVAGYLLVSQ